MPKANPPLPSRPGRPGFARPEAFTVVELLVVIAIVVLLVAVMAPTFMGIGKRATSVRCGANLHQIGQAFAKRRAEMGLSVGSLTGNRSYYYPTGLQWPSIPYGNCKQAAIFACPAIGETIGEGDRPNADTILKGIVYKSNWAGGVYAELSDPQFQGYGHDHAAVIQSTTAEGRVIDFCVEDVHNYPVLSIAAQGDDGAVHITLDTFPVEATLTDGGCGAAANCLLYYGKPMFPQWAGKPADPAEWYDPASIYYGYTGYDKRKVGQKVPLDGLRCDYGINKDAYRMTAGESKIAVIDYDESQVLWEEAAINTKLAKAADRHAGTINVLNAGGSVVNMTPAQLNPLMPGVQNDLWKP